MKKIKHRKGIVLAGGSGSRLYPVTNVVSKQLLPVYDKPMVYYPIATLMQAKIREILIISTPMDINNYRNLLSDGSQWGIKITYEIQKKPEGIAQAFVIGEEFIDHHPIALILGDNIFYGNDLDELLSSANNVVDGAIIFAYHVNDPERYGVVEFDNDHQVISIEEKPINPKTNYAITGLYFYDNNVVDYAKTLNPSERGELEITDLNKIYLKLNKLGIKIMDRGYAWLDTGTHESLLEASQFISTIENRQGLKVACPEEIAFSNGWISLNDLENIAKGLNDNQYKNYILSIINKN